MHSVVPCGECVSQDVRPELREASGQCDPAPCLRELIALVRGGVGRPIGSLENETGLVFDGLQSLDDAGLQKQLVQLSLALADIHPGHLMFWPRIIPGEASEHVFFALAEPDEQGQQPRIMRVRCVDSCFDCLGCEPRNALLLPSVPLGPPYRRFAAPTDLGSAVKGGENRGVELPIDRSDRCAIWPNVLGDVREPFLVDRPDGVMAAILQDRPQELTFPALIKIDLEGLSERSARVLPEQNLII